MPKKENPQPHACPNCKRPDVEPTHTGPRRVPVPPVPTVPTFLVHVGAGCHATDG